jgi:hypothetical protein
MKTKMFVRLNKFDPWLSTKQVQKLGDTWRDIAIQYVTIQPSLICVTNFRLLKTSCQDFKPYPSRTSLTNSGDLPIATNLSCVVCTTQGSHGQFCSACFWESGRRRLRGPSPFIKWPLLPRQSSAFVAIEIAARSTRSSRS